MAVENYKRKLTAILSANVTGYSRLMGDDEVATVSTLKTHCNQINKLFKISLAITGIWRIIDAER